MSGLTAWSREEERSLVDGGSRLPVLNPSESTLLEDNAGVPWACKEDKELWLEDGTVILVARDVACSRPSSVRCSVKATTTTFHARS